jgi:hypothetical protein
MKRVLLILLIWFLSSSVASAGCAWVLWEMTFTSVSKEADKLTVSKPVSAWNSKEDCELALLKRVEETHEAHQIVRPGLVEKEDGTMFDSRCLPDTLDPGKTIKAH